MRQLERFLIFVLELTVIPAGVLIPLLLTALAGTVDEFFVPFAFTTGLTLTLLALARLRRRTRPWKIQYDAASWVLERAERNLSPVRARRKRIAERVALRIPTAIAAFVLLFFPVATHLVHPGVRYFRHFRVPIPWTQAVFSGSEWATTLRSLFCHAAAAGDDLD